MLFIYTCTCYVLHATRPRSISYVIECENDSRNAIRTTLRIMLRRRPLLELLNVRLDQFSSHNVARRSDPKYSLVQRSRHTTRQYKTKKMHDMGYTTYKIIYNPASLQYESHRDLKEKNINRASGF